MKSLILLLLLIFSVVSCREGVIVPGVFVENVNDPVQINERNSYTFLLNADSFSMDLSVFLSINSSKSRINITLVDYQSGYAKVSLMDNENRVRYNYHVAQDVTFHTDIIDGYIPKSVSIKTGELSGKIKIELRKSL